MIRYSITRNKSGPISLRRLRLFLPFLAFILVSLIHGNQTRAAALFESPKRQGQQGVQEVIALEPGGPIERELAAGQKHCYKITLTEGQYLKVEIKQLSIAVRVNLRQPDGKTTPVFDIPRRMPEVVFDRVAELSGIYFLDLYGSLSSPRGFYSIRIAELRPATENESALQQARNLFYESFELQRVGKYLEARALMIRMLEIQEEVLGPEHPAVADTLDHLASNYNTTGDYASGEQLRLRALQINEKVLGPDDPGVAQVLGKLGQLYLWKGDYFKAEEMCQRALGIYEKAQRAETSSTALSLLGVLGDIYYARADYQNAERYYQRSRAGWEKILGPDHTHLASSFTHLGLVAYDAGDYAKAEAMFQRALFLSEKVGQDHLSVTRYLSNLAAVYGTTGEYAKAEALYRRALSVHEQKAAMSHPDVQAVLFGLARLYAAQDRLSEAVKFQARASEIEERHVKMNLAAGSQREKLAFLSKLSARSYRNISLHTQLAPNDPAARDLAVTTILQRKGRVQDVLSASSAALRQRLDAEDRHLLDQLNEITSRLAGLAISGPQKMTPAEHQEWIKAVEEDRERLEAEISRRSAGFYERSQPITLDAVQAAIPHSAALIEMAVYRPFDPKAPDKTAYGEPRYVAYVMRKKGEVLWKDLGDAKPIDAAIEAWRQALRERKRQDVQELARAVDEKMMQPVRSLLGDATHLLISPDGALNLIPFGALVDEQNHYLVKRFAFTYLSSGRDLLRLQVARESKSPPLLLANPAFGEPELMAMTKPTAPAPPPSSLDRKQSAKTKPQSVTNLSDLSDVYFAPLTGTAQEAQAIKSLFAEAVVLTNAQATESSLKHASAPRLMHIATHGFFLTDSPAASSNAGGEKTRSISANLKVENPLLRSGLALAGANLHKSGDDDGILTAMEASGLNLWGTKLVTLSACDTGVGEVRNGEGVYGLRRALVLAGAESLVMSLWPVSDYVTRELMTAYYKSLKQGLGRGEALRQVQLAMLKRKGREHPFYWASFIQSGEWANLDGKR